MNLRETLLRESVDSLIERFKRGHPLSAAELAGNAYAGTSLGVPSAFEKLTWKTFRKCFVQEGGKVRGWNVRMKQAGTTHTHQPMQTRCGNPKTFGPFEVCSTRGYAMPTRRGERVYLHRGLLLDYGKKQNPLPLRFLRDPLVSLERGKSELLLGCSYLDFGLARPLTPSFFLLEREGPVSFVDIDRPR